jgi:hypothetical protein
MKTQGSVKLKLALKNRKVGKYYDDFEVADPRKV